MSSSNETSIWKTVQKELDERLKISELAEVASHKTVPVHKHSIWYYFGGISLFFFVIMMVTGMLLLMQYQLGLATAHASVERINTKVEFGQFIRSLHSWGANLMVGSVLIHMFSAYFMKAYQKPRELTWFSGLGLLLLVITLGFTGYLLPWDSTAFFATKVGLNIAETTPWAPAPWNANWIWPGTIAADILRGGSDLTNLTIQRFGSIHYVILPWIFAGLLGFHLLLVQLHGNTIPKKIEENKQYRSIPFFPNFFYEDLFAWLLVLTALCILAVYFPWGLEAEADPLAAAPLGIHPEWYFMAPFEVLKWMPPSLGPINGEFIGVALFGGASALLFLVPIWNPKDEYKILGLTIPGNLGRAATYYGIFALFGLIAFTWLAYGCLNNNHTCQLMHDFLPSIVRSFSKH